MDPQKIEPDGVVLSALTDLNLDPIGHHLKVLGGTSAKLFAFSP